MTVLTRVELEDGTSLYIEATDNVQVAEDKNSSSESGGRISRGGAALPQFKAIEETIRAYTTYALNAFKDLAIANIDQVTLSFGIEISGEAGIPYITKGSAKSNLNITVQCSFPDQPS